jgi:hypothetical protein
MHGLRTDPLGEVDDASEVEIALGRTRWTAGMGLVRESYVEGVAIGL